MGFELEMLRAKVAQHGRVTRVVIAALRGSSPREVGAAMLVWQGGQTGTIGGGALEYEAAEMARDVVDQRVTQHALGPDLGQCCGGVVTLLSEVYDAGKVAALDGDIVARPVKGTSDMPMHVKRCLAQARGQGVAPDSHMVDGWMIEPVHKPTRMIWVWGAGHVGRAIVQVLAPIPDLEITWIDTATDRFPDAIPDGVTMVPASNPAVLVDHAPQEAEHLILTYSHALDLELCHRLLAHGFGFAGVIGSKTKWARFRARLAALGHAPKHITDITCPIGDPSLGKHPQMIAVGVAGQLLRPALRAEMKKDQCA